MKAARRVGGAQAERAAALGRIRPPSERVGRRAGPPSSLGRRSGSGSTSGCVSGTASPARLRQNRWACSWVSPATRGRDRRRRGDRSPGEQVVVEVLPDARAGRRRHGDAERARARRPGRCPESSSSWGESIVPAQTIDLVAWPRRLERRRARSRRRCSARRRSAAGARSAPVSTRQARRRRRPASRNAGRPSRARRRGSSAA